MASSISKQARSLLIEIEDHPQLTVTDSALPSKTRSESEHQALAIGFSEDFINAYQAINGFKLHWYSKQNPSTKGAIQFLPLTKVVQSWEGVVYFNDTPPNDALRQFYPLDFWADEACAGVYVGENRLYYYPFEGQPLDLEVDIAGYIELVLTTKGFWYWPQLIRYFITNEPSWLANHYQTEMPHYFPDHTLVALQKTFERLRLPLTNFR
ncbi:MAG: hypothetical protein U0Y10_20865 [Spirosomataceae bacterium]